MTTHCTTTVTPGVLSTTIISVDPPVQTNNRAVRPARCTAGRGHRSGPGDSPPALDYKWYLDFLGSHHHNFFRLWRWESPKWTDDEPNGVAYARPHPWLRTGPGLAADEKPKFDLTCFAPEYFARMRQRIQAAGERGMYVSVMLFEGWEVEFLDAWTCHPYNAASNINGIDADLDHDGVALVRAT